MGIGKNVAETFSARLRRSPGDLDLLEPMMYWDVTFWDFGLLCDDKMEALESEIHQILFPNIQVLWVDYCAKLGLNPERDKPDKKWRNATCDVQAFWSHAVRKRDVVVTSDRNFHADEKKRRLLSRAGSRIETPEGAALRLRDAQSIKRCPEP